MSADNISNGTSISDRALQYQALRQQSDIITRLNSNGEKEALGTNATAAADTVEISDEARFRADFAAKLGAWTPDSGRELAARLNRSNDIDERGYYRGDGLCLGGRDTLFPTGSFNSEEERDEAISYIKGKLESAGIDLDVVGRMNFTINAKTPLAKSADDYRVYVNRIPTKGYGLTSDEIKQVEDVLAEDKHLKEILHKASDLRQEELYAYIYEGASSDVFGNGLGIVPEKGLDAGTATTETARATSTQHSFATTATEEKDVQPLWKSPESIAEYFGFGGVDSRKELVTLMESRVGKSRDELQPRINELLEKNDITLGEDDRLTFSIDSKGEIKVGGIKDKEKLKQIEDILNEDEELGSQLRTLAAEQSALQAIRRGTAPEAPVRRALVESLLTDKGLTLKDVDTSEDGKALLTNMGLNAAQIAEIDAIKEQDAVSFKAALEFQNGTLVNSDVVKKTYAMISDLFSSVKIEHPQAMHLVDALTIFNEMADEYDGERIDSFTFRMIDGGSLSVEREGLNDGDASMISSWFGTDFKDAVRAVTEELLVEHQAEHGDVDEFKHEVVFHVDAQSGISAEIRSEEADRAARAEIDEASKKFSGVINDYLSDSPLAAPVQIEMDESGTLRMTGDDTIPEAMQVKQIVDILNLALQQDDRSILSDELASAFDHVSTIRDGIDKIHDPEQRTATITLGG